ncbi:MAG: thiamine pyrophosphate-binding protein [Deltaproteobacteria bacterium]|nr:thiamine pyrophosphate-binding protein [Deltaproteobacteria bacterium]
MIKLSDYVAEFIAAQGVRHVFMVVGGGAMHLNDSVGHQGAIEFVCTLHDQACAIAAEAYAKVTENLGVALVTTGPGGTNAVTGVAGAWQDSTPCLFISGQVKRSDLIRGMGVRQNGVQEIDIVSIVRPITKYAVTVMEPETIRYHLEQAVYLARSGRPGPAWVDIPLDVQAASIDVDALPGFAPEQPPSAVRSVGLPVLVGRTIELLNKAERPIILIGNGVRLAKAREEVQELIAELKLPVLLTWPALDMLPDSHELVVGRPGPVAPRGANFALQNSDWLLSIGARLDTVVTGYAHERFAPAAKKIMVDVDGAEIAKMKMPIDVPVCADARDFVRELRRQGGRVAPRDRSRWLARCGEWKRRYPVVLPEYRREKRVSTYVLADVLSDELTGDDVVVPGSSGTGIEVFLLAFRAKAGQRVFNTTALGAMGFGLPASIGGCLASGRRRTVCVNGDGGLQLNVQELETVARLKLPIKLFVLNNQGYASIRASQTRYFGRLTGADAASGVTLPDIGRVASAYGLPAEKIVDQSDLRQRIREVLNAPGPVVCDVWTPPDEPRCPSLVSKQWPDGSLVSTPLEDLWPFLDRDEFLANMIVPVAKE